MASATLLSSWDDMESGEVRVGLPNDGFRRSKFVFGLSEFDVAEDPETRDGVRGGSNLAIREGGCTSVRMLYSSSTFTDCFSGDVRRDLSLAFGSGLTG